MLELLGFIVFFGFGLYAFFGGAVGLFAAKAFGSSHRSDYVLPALLVIVGAFAVWEAVQLAPFTINFERAAQAVKQGG